MTKTVERFTSRKWIIGCSSFVALITLLILEANNVLVLDQFTKVTLGSITTAWLIAEGFIDYKKEAKK